MNVLNELPEELRLEIIREHQLYEVTEAQSKTEKGITPKSGSSSSSEVSSKGLHKKDLPLKHKEPKLGFHMLTYDEIKAAVIKWLNFGKAPKDTDIKMFGNYLRQLAIDREIDKLHRITKFLFR